MVLIFTWTLLHISPLHQFVSVFHIFLQIVSHLVTLLSSSLPSCYLNLIIVTILQLFGLKDGSSKGLHAPTVLFWTEVGSGSCGRTAPLASPSRAWGWFVAEKVSFCAWELHPSKPAGPGLEKCCTMIETNFSILETQRKLLLLLDVNFVCWNPTLPVGLWGSETRIFEMQRRNSFQFCLGFFFLSLFFFPFASDLLKYLRIFLEIHQE